MNNLKDTPSYFKANSLQNSNIHYSDFETLQAIAGQLHAKIFDECKSNDFITKHAYYLNIYNQALYQLRVAFIEILLANILLFKDKAQSNGKDLKQLFSEFIDCYEHILTKKGKSYIEQVLEKHEELSMINGFKLIKFSSLIQIFKRLIDNIKTKDFEHISEANDFLRELNNAVRRYYFQQGQRKIN